jgi:hypothetical protein
MHSIRSCLDIRSKSIAIVMSLALTAKRRSRRAIRLVERGLEDKGHKDATRGGGRLRCIRAARRRRSEVTHMPVELGTTNLLLGIMAAASVFEALVIIGMGVAGFVAYRKVLAVVDGIETRQVAPAMARINAILDDVKTVTAKVKEETERVDHAIHTTMDRIDDTAGRLRSSVRARTSAVVGFVRGLSVAIEWMLQSRHRTNET